MVFLQFLTCLLLCKGLHSMSIHNTTNEIVDVVALKQDVESIKDQVHNLTRLIENDINSYKQGVFFSARLSRLTYLNKNSIVKFNEVVTDSGNNFNHGNGMFVAPVSGYYQFSWTTFTYSNKIVDTELRVDNVIVDAMYAHISVASSIPATKIAICWVNKGDHVWIQTTNSYSENVIHNPNESNAKISFLGFLIEEKN
ncbi:unnamed protein product [Mytilus coruscus]|uniref:C1q domain-containing protein n=1 Tax=Mytilus coruscus TaxID=42192 RepID=A0A6J8D3Z2_MYTCO|nr:unnamed protein product [Mytilus coruscus]